MFNMGMKRTANDVETSQPRSRHKDPKRVKFTRSDERDSSDPSSRSVSEDSALRSSPPASEHDRKSSVSSIQSPLSDDESVSSVIDSDSDTSSDSSTSGDEEIITIGGPKKPRMMQTEVVEGAQDLRSRLDSFLPQLAASNEVLSSGRANFNIEDVEDGEQHIEMNLGLGVLEEKRHDSADSDSCSTSEEEQEDDTEDTTLHSSDVIQRPSERQHPNIIRKVFSQSSQRRRPGIEDLG